MIPALPRDSNIRSYPSLFTKDQSVTDWQETAKILEALLCAGGAGRRDAVATVVRTDYFAHFIPERYPPSARLLHTRPEDDSSLPRLGPYLGAKGAEQLPLDSVPALLAARSGREPRHLRDRTGAIHGT